jgi:hypothetical protein
MTYKPIYPELEALATAELEKTGTPEAPPEPKEEKLIWQRIVEDEEWLKEMQKAWWEAYPPKKKK